MNRVTMPPASGMSRRDQLIRWQKIRELPENNKCAECHALDTSWAVLDYGTRRLRRFWWHMRANCVARCTFLAGILICINCAGAHRAMGTHISKVRSPELDEFSDDEFTWIEHQGNMKSNLLYESAIPQRMRRPAPDSPDCIRRRWLREKYDLQMFSAGSEHKGAHPHESAEGWLMKRGHIMKTWKRCAPPTPHSIGPLEHGRPEPAHGSPTALACATAPPPAAHTSPAAHTCSILQRDLRQSVRPPPLYEAHTPRAAHASQALLSRTERRHARLLF